MSKPSARGAAPAGQAPSTTLRAAAASDPGPFRSTNEDRFFLDAERGAFAVIDGVGGHAAGEVAAEIALRALGDRLRRRTGTPERRLREAVALANEEIRSAARRNPEWAGMGCVLTVALVEDGALTAAHVGDSRLYLVRGSSLRKLTHDHSPIGEREDAGELGELEAMRHPRRNEVYRTLGFEEHAPEDEGFVEIVREPFGPGDALLLCSDGLTDAITSEDIGRLVERHAGDAQRLADRLVEAATAEGKDNVTVVFAAGERFGTTDAVASTGPAARSGSARTWLAFAAGVVLALLATALVEVRRARAPVLVAPAGDPVAHAAGPIRVGPGAFATISEAMGAARPGDTILLADGVYREALRLPEGVTVRAEHPRRAVIAPPRDAASATVAVFAEAIASGRIAGLKIEPGEGGLDIGVLVRGAVIEIDDCEVTGARRAGIEVDGAAAPALRSSLVHRNAGAGVMIGAGAAPRILHNRIVSNGKAGIDAAPGARPELAENVLAGNAGGR